MSCDRFAAEALLLLERGLPLDEHFVTCPDCLAARAAYDRLRAEIAAAGEEDAPPAGWQARVWERIEQRRERREGWRRPRLWWLVPAGVGVAASMALFLLRPPGQAGLSLKVDVQPGATVRRGTEAHPGDLLRLTAAIGGGRPGGARHAELRVYRNDSELILRCSTERPCSRRGDELRASVVLDAAGRYQPLLLVSRQLLPPATSDLEKDTSAALAVGAQVELGTEIVVR